MRAALLLLGLMAGAACAATWNVSNWNFATIAVAVAFVDENNGVSPVGVNGEGSFIWQTTDGGNTWNPANSPSELMYLGAAANSAGDQVVADEFSLLYQQSAGTFASSNLATGITSQNVEAFGASSFAAAGDGLVGGNGIAVSTDNGQNFNFVNISVLKTDARYGAYPSATTWFVSAGEWPNNGQRDSSVRQLTKRIGVQQEGKKIRHVMQRTVDPAEPRGDAGSWRAQIVKTTDGGNTWTSVFYQQGTFYFNEISCGSTTNCCAVGEADTSAKPGIRIWCTWDGGKTWTQTVSNTDPNYSIMAIDFVPGSSTEAWAAGGDMENFAGYFWHTTDAGKTWSSVVVDGIYGNCMAFVSASKGWATGFTFEDQSALLTFQ